MKSLAFKLWQLAKVWFHQVQQIFNLCWYIWNCHAFYIVSCLTEFFNFWKPDLGKIIIRQFENNFQHWQDEEETKTSFTRWGVCATVCTRFNRTGLQNPKWSGNVLSSVMEQYNTHVFVSKLFKNYLNTLQHEKN